MTENTTFFHKQFNRWNVNTTTIGSIISEMDNGTLDIPSYQRNLVWTPKQQQVFLKTISRGGFIPSIILNILSDGSGHIVDGQNRLKTIQKFMNGLLKANFKVENEDGTITIVKLNYDDLSPPEKRKFKNIDLTVYELSDWNDDDCHEMFLLVQYGVKPTYGEILHSQQNNLFHINIKDILNSSQFITSKEGLNINDKRYKDYEFIGALIIAQVKGVSKSDMGKCLENFMNDVKNGEAIINQVVIDKIKSAIDYYEKIYFKENIHKYNLNAATNILNIYYIMNNFEMTEEELPEIAIRLNAMLNIVQDSIQYISHPVAYLWGEEGRTHTQPLKRWGRIEPVYNHFFKEINVNSI